MILNENNPVPPDVVLELAHKSVYDPVKSREYYLRTRKLKGRRKDPGGGVQSTSVHTAERKLGKLEADKERLSKVFKRAYEAHSKAKDPTTRSKLESVMERARIAVVKNRKARIAASEEYEKERSAARKRRSRAADKKDERRSRAMAGKGK